MLGILAFAFAQVHMHRVAFAVLIPTFMKNFHLSYAECGLIMSSFFWTHAVVQIPVGIFSDRFGASRVIKACVLTLAIGIIAFVLSRNMTQFIISRALMGLGGAFLVPGTSIVREKIHYSNHGLAIGIITAGGAFGGTSGLILISFLVGILGWRFSYAITIIPILFTVFLVIFFMKPPENHKITKIAKKNNAIISMNILVNPTLWFLSLSVMFFFGAYFSFLTWLPSFLVKHFNIPDYQAGLITSLATAGTIISWPLSGFIADRLNRYYAIFRYSQALCFILALILTFSAHEVSLLGIIFISLVMGLVFGGMSLPYVIVLRLFSLGFAGTINGIINTFSFIGALFIPVVLGFIINRTGNFAIAFGALALCFFLAFILSYRCFISMPK
ncbi:MAG: MFS transporter [bacterium]